ncbi:flavodoxin domain-containing protein [Streptomyces sp. NPDC046332]|uniref:flavodoxin domain-containing protein n=1 Tax=unclassified Streptomyces TaxID=2593676 RepID=UPI0033E10735
MNATRVLVAYGGKAGATTEIAAEIGRKLRDDGFDAVVLPADTVTDVSAYDAVVLGGALHGRSPLRRALDRQGTTVCGGGPLDRSREQHDIPPYAESPGG